MLNEIHLALLRYHIAVDIQALGMECFYTRQIDKFFLIVKAVIERKCLNNIDNEAFSHFQKLDQVTKNEQHWWNFYDLVILSDLWEEMRAFLFFLQLGLNEISIERNVMNVTFISEIR